MVTFLPGLRGNFCGQKQQDGDNCDLFAMTFPAQILDNKSPICAVFHVP